MTRSTRISRVHNSSSMSSTGSIAVVILAAAGLVTTMAADPVPAAEATSVHVASVDVTLIKSCISTWRQGQCKVRPEVDVLIVDDLGSPVSGVVVTGTFSGDLIQNDVTVSGVTGADGSVRLSAGGWYHYRRYRLPFDIHDFTFCVDSVDASLPYNPGENFVTCDTETTS